MYKKKRGPVRLDQTFLGNKRVKEREERRGGGAGLEPIGVTEGSLFGGF